MADLLNIKDQVESLQLPEVKVVASIDDRTLFNLFLVIAGAALFTAFIYAAVIRKAK